MLGSQQEDCHLIPRHRLTGAIHQRTSVAASGDSSRIQLLDVFPCPVGIGYIAEGVLRDCVHLATGITSIATTIPTQRIIAAIPDAVIIYNI